MDRISVNLRIASLVLPPSEMTRFLGAPSDHSVIGGVDRQPSTPLPKRHPWSLFISKEGDPLAEEMLLEVVEGAEVVLPRMGDLQAADPDVTIGFHVALACTTIPVLSFKPVTITKLNRFEGSLDVDFFEPEQGLSWPGSQDWCEG